MMASLPTYVALCFDCIILSTEFSYEELLALPQTSLYRTMGLSLCPCFLWGRGMYLKVGELPSSSSGLY